MRKRFAAIVVASALVVPAAADAAAPSGAPVDASASQATQRTMKSALRKDVKRALRSVAKLDLATVSSKGFTLKRIRGLTAGKVSFIATMRSQGKAVTVTKGSRKFGKRGKKNVRVKLTSTGKRLLGASNRVTLRVKATFKPRGGRRVSVVFRVTLTRSPGTTIGPEGGTLPPAKPIAPIPEDATPLYSQNFDSPRVAGPRPWGGLSEQCPSGTLEWGSEEGDGYARFTVLAGDPPPVEGDTLERCEVSHGGYDDAREPGAYYYHARLRLGPGFPHQPAPNVFTTIQQWQEDRPGPAGTGAVDAALFVNAGPVNSPTARMFLDGHHFPALSQGPLFSTGEWVNVVVEGTWTDQPNGSLRWFMGSGNDEPTEVGVLTGITSETGGRHFWKGGITRHPDIATLQTADIAEVNVYRK
jgi:hypothetical protein